MALNPNKGAPLAVHLPDGNRFADLRLDIAASIAAHEPWLAEVGPTTA